MPGKYGNTWTIWRGGHLYLSAVLLGLLLLLAACGSNSSTTTTGAAPAPTPTATTSSQSQSSTNTGDYGGYGNTASNTTPTTQAAATGPKQSIDMAGQNGAYSFTPATMTISVGTTVVWTNKSDTVHTVTSDDGTSFDSGSSNPIDSNGTFSFTFKKAGTYAYHCKFHPSMKATIIVQ